MASQKYNREYYAKNKDRVKATIADWRARNPEKQREYTRRKLAKLKDVVFEAYGGRHPKCKCCGENDIRFLSVDHINGGGTKHKNSVPGRSIYRWLKRNGFPKGYQLLCHNCNQGKHIYGKCPHKLKI